MAENVVFDGGEVDITLNVDGGEVNAASSIDGNELGAFYRAIESLDYLMLLNKPRVNGVELIGDKSADDLGLAYRIKYGTRAYWGEDLDFIPKQGEIIIYTDYDTVNGVKIPAIKIGDGMAYAVDLPFVSDDIRDRLIRHITDMTAHITEEERSSWNNKVRCYLDGDVIVFTTH